MGESGLLASLRWYEQQRLAAEQRRLRCSHLLSLLQREVSSEMERDNRLRIADARYRACVLAAAHTAAAAAGARVPGDSAAMPDSDAVEMGAALAEVDAAHAVQAAKEAGKRAEAAQEASDAATARGATSVPRRSAFAALGPGGGGSAAAAASSLAAGTMMGDGTAFTAADVAKVRFDVARERAEAADGLMRVCEAYRLIPASTVALYLRETLQCADDAAAELEAAASTAAPHPFSLTAAGKAGVAARAQRARESEAEALSEARLASLASSSESSNDSDGRAGDDADTAGAALASSASGFLFTSRGGVRPVVVPPRGSGGDSAGEDVEGSPLPSPIHAEHAPKQQQQQQHQRQQQQPGSGARTTTRPQRGVLGSVKSAARRGSTSSVTGQAPAVETVADPAEGLFPYNQPARKASDRLAAAMPKAEPGAAAADAHKAAARKPTWSEGRVISAPVGDVSWMLPGPARQRSDSRRLPLDPHPVHPLPTPPAAPSSCSSAPALTA